MFSRTIGRQGMIAGLISVGVLALATPAVAQLRGKVTDEQGRPIAGATIEVTIVSESVPGFVVQQQRRGGDRKWHTKTNDSGDYLVGVSISGVYLVAASKEGIGYGEIEVAVQVGSVTNANLRLWNAASARVPETDCANRTAIKAFEESELAKNAVDPALARLLRWLEAVQLHTPGCADSPAIEVGNWSYSREEFETLIADVMNLSKFLQMDPQNLTAGFEIRSQVGSRESRARLVAAARDAGGFVRPGRIELYGQWFTRDEIEQIFHGNTTLRRGAVLHADIAVFVPGNLSRRILVDDGRWKGVRPGTRHWEIGRLLLDVIMPSPSDDAGALLWYRAVSAYLLREGRLSEVPAHLNRARQLFPDNPVFLLDSAYLHEELSSPSIQAAVEELRDNNVTALVGSRIAELQHAERLFRQALAIAPDNADARLRLGYTLGELGQHEEAVAELRRAIDAKPVGERLYLAELFLGREEQALGRYEGAKQRFETAAVLYPTAQSPRLALGQLARQFGDRAGALRAVRSIADATSDDAADPWWSYYEPHKQDAEALMDQMRKLLGSIYAQ
jgi:tetratricopeptide (TPR) repeat protein